MLYFIITDVGESNFHILPTSVLIAMEILVRAHNKDNMQKTKVWLVLLFACFCCIEEA